MSDKNPTEIMVTNGYGARTKKAFITITVHPADWSIQLVSNEARKLAQNILQAAEAADNDAFFIEFLKVKVGMDDSQIMVLLQEYREWRENKGINQP